MKSFIKCLALLGVLLLTASPTVKAGEKPDTSTHTLSVKIVPVGGGTWNYTNAQLFAAVHSAIPDFNPTSVDFENPGVGVYWLHFKGTLTSTGKSANVYFHLVIVGPWYELDDNGVANGGGWSCSGRCEPEDGEGPYISDDVCKNTSTTVMVRCECTLSGYADCEFKQYPKSIATTMVEVIKQMPPVVE